jgi:hypothetical protein
MRFTRAATDPTHPLFQFTGRQLPLRLHGLALAMHPLKFALAAGARVEVELVPGTPRWAWRASGTSATG